MVSNRSLRVAILVSLAVLPAAVSWARGPSTEEERKKAVQLTHMLESDPLGKGAKQAMSWLTKWLAEVPDISVSLCPALLGPGFDMKQKYGAELVMLQGFSAAAFKIEHPEQANDAVAVNTASVEGVLHAYEAILAENPKVQSASLEALRRARNAGQLSAQVAELTKSCH
jgi:hypothetical protein